MNDPNISLKVTFSLKKRTAGGIINTGTREIIVEVMPVSVYLTEIKEKETPKNACFRRGVSRPERIT